MSRGSELCSRLEHTRRVRFSDNPGSSSRRAACGARAGAGAGPGRRPRAPHPGGGAPRGRRRAALRAAAGARTHEIKPLLAKNRGAPATVREQK